MKTTRRVSRQNRKTLLRTLAFLLHLLFHQVALGQSFTAGGVIRDSLSKLPLPNVTVLDKTSRKGTRTDSTGHFTLTLNRGQADLQLSCLGYDLKTFRVNTNNTNLEIALSPSSIMLTSVTVTSDKKIKYANQNNPAVELIRKVIDHKPDNRVNAADYVSFNKYEKLQVSLSNFNERGLLASLLKKYKFVFENPDTVRIPGKKLFPAYLEETISEVYLQKNPAHMKTIVLDRKKVDYGDLVDARGLSTYLNRLYDEVDIYKNNIFLLTNEFVSPISDLAPAFYMYFIRDTVEISGSKLVKLYFTPRNPNDMLFRGNMYVTLDGKYAVKKLDMTVSTKINLNFLRELHIAQDFLQNGNGKYYLKRSNLMADMGLSKGGMGIFGERTVSFDHFSNAALPDTLWRGFATVDLSSAARPDSFWLQARHEPLSSGESRTYHNIDSLKNMPSFQRTMDMTTLLIAGYKQAGPIEIGPVNTFYSFNPVEGFRLRFGGRTTPKFSNRYYFESYGAYAFKDAKWKYYLGVTYSFTKQSVYAWPNNYLRASFQHEIKIPGQELQFVQEDNFLLSFKRGNNDRWLYNDIARIDYVKEFSNNNLSLTLGTKYWKQSPGGTIQFNQPENGTINSLDNITTGEVSASLRWAPKEQFYQGKLYRVPLVNRYPVFTLRYINGIKGLYGGEYSYQHLNLNIFKRFYLSPLGYSDVTFDAGYLFGQVPFPLMDIHHANQTYAYQLNSFNLMNFMEFVSDHYVGVSVDHYFNGAIFNKVPLLKKFKWREVLTAKVLYGSVRDENNPAVNPSAMSFPTTNGLGSTFLLGSKPYVEAGFGIANIGKLLRVDFIKRFTYLDNPDIPKFGIRARIKLDF